ncbi:unnamed protein product [Adineta ricciae]|uniref:Uncharacterized protein n=2 Tax=Adineta ricciae TaxID=249248 RepID=A0A815FV07_ADIRI|nr:unnamed protein product [Adineta ricciae]
MQSSTSLHSLSSTTSSNSSSYGSRTILETKDLPYAAPRCRSSIAAFLEDDDAYTLMSPPSSPVPPPPPPPRRRRSQLSTSNKSIDKCRQLFRTCLASTASPLALSTHSKLSTSFIRQEYFAKLCQTHRLLLVLSSYHCECGCQFSMEEGSYVVLYDQQSQSSSSYKTKGGLVTVISNGLVCSKVPCEYVCDVELLRSRVRLRRYGSGSDDEQSFDL